MQSTLHEPQTDAWERLAPLLDEAMTALGDNDRNAIAMRFFENKTAAEIATTLKLNEETAQKRVSRALEKLRKILTKRGVTLSAAVIAAAVSSNSVQAAPVGLASTVTLATAKGAAVSGSTLAMVKGVLKFMAWTKAQVASVIAAVIFLGAGSVLLSFHFDSAGATESFEYEAEGELKGTRYLAFGNTQELPSVAFKLYVRDNRWMIRVPHPHPRAKSITMSCDGQALYELAMLEAKATDTVEISPPVQISSSGIVWKGAVSADMVPFYGLEPSLPVIWLALASSDYLDKTGAKMIPAYSTDLIRDPLPVSVNRMSDAVRLPNRIVFKDDGFDRRFGQPQKRRPPYDRGFTNAIYSVSAVTNIGSVSLPCAFTLRVFGPEYSRSDGTVRLEREYVGTVTNISPSCSLQVFLPEMEGNGSISDLRFVSPDALSKRPFQYRTSRWLTAQEVEEMPGFTQYLSSERELKGLSPVSVITNQSLPNRELPTPSKPGQSGAHQ